MYGIKDDLELIRFNIPKECKAANIIFIGDCHIGSPQYDTKAFDKVLTQLKEPDTYAILLGDLLDMALKNSKSNVYEQTMSPHQQKQYLKNMLYPHREKILCIIPGNHENRQYKDCDAFPLYDIACKLDIEDRYRHNMVLLDIGVGERSGNKQYHYFGCVSHKTNKTMRYHFSDTIDGIDFHVSGHTHTPSDTPKSKVIVDVHNKTANIKPVETIVVPSLLNYCGYPIESAYRVPSKKHYKLILNGSKKEMKTEGYYL